MLMLKRQLNILSLSDYDHAGCGYFLSRAVNRHTMHTSWHIRNYSSRIMKFPYQYMRKDSLVMELWKRADVVHVHDNYSNLINLMPRKPMIFTYHGTNYRAHHERINSEHKQKGYIQTVATLDLTRYCDKWLPDTRILPEISSTTLRKGGFVVCQSPSKPKKKSTEKLVSAALKISGMKADIITGVTWQESIERRGMADVTFDQMQYGYGCSSIEAWMMGQPVISGAIDIDVTKAIEKKLGELPYVNVGVDGNSIEECIKRLKDDALYYKKMANIGQRYCKTFHSAEHVANVASKYYYEALESSHTLAYCSVHDINMFRARGQASYGGHRVVKGKGKSAAKQASGETTRLRYMGKNVGTEEYQGKTGAIYKVRKGDLVDVFDDDVQSLLDIRVGGDKKRGKSRVRGKGKRRVYSNKMFVRA